MSYYGRAKKFLGDIKIGDRVVVRRKGKIIEGILMPRNELADDEHIVIKLDNGYNIGISIKNAEIEHEKNKNNSNGRNDSEQS